MSLEEPIELLGYQLRISPSLVAGLWPRVRREEFLLDPMIAAPLSADARVWPLAENSGLAKKLFEDFSTDQNEAPNGLNLYQLRIDAANAFEHLNHSGEMLVAIGAAQSIAKMLRAKHSFADTHGGEFVGDEQRELLGYDVCDQSLLSGLTNCAVHAEQPRLRERYARLLNVHGLFDDRDAAKRFATEISHVVPEHAPFLSVSVAKVRR